ncbi:aromatic-ring-hydroxylating dioxygenase subunit beta [Nocardia sp. NPDC004278]
MAVKDEIEALLLREARLLDECQYGEWLALLTDDVTYSIPLTSARADELAIICEDRFRVEARVWRVEQTGLNHTQDPPSRTVRAVSNIEVETDIDVTTARFVTVLYEWRPGGQRFQQPLNVIPMRCEYGLRKESDRWLICRRELILLQRDGDLPPMTFLV